MNSILAVELGLPPGLWLPLPEEDTEQYRRERFNHANHSMERVVDLGAFATALIVFKGDKDRLSYMPRQEDFEELFAAGYGLSKYHLDKPYGGLSGIQSRLGFYPRGSRPDKEETLQRAKWMAAYAIPLDKDFDMQDAIMSDILRWGAKRNLMPSADYVMGLFGDDQRKLQRIFGKERPNALRWYRKQDLYRFGARVLAENGRPITRDEINTKYGDMFIGNPDHIITEHFGTSAHFWAEFGWYMNQKGMKPAELVDIGVRMYILNPGNTLSYSKAEALSADGRFPSPYLLETHFGRFTVYREKVEKVLQEFWRVREGLIKHGVSNEVITLAARKYSTEHNSFELWRKYAHALHIISADTSSATYVRKLMREGLNLHDDTIFSMQKQDLIRALRGMKIKSRNDISFIIGLIPCLDLSEIIPMKPPTRRHMFNR